ncbi:MAG: hypothetical protein ACI4EC_08155 [Lachnospiraceae bacterium]
MGRLIIDGNRVYELDEACLQRKGKTCKTTDSDRNMRMQKEREKQMQRRGRS